MICIGQKQSVLLQKLIIMKKINFTCNLNESPQNSYKGCVYVADSTEHSIKAMIDSCVVVDHPDCLVYCLLYYTIDNGSSIMCNEVRYPQGKHRG